MRTITSPAPGTGSSKLDRRARNVAFISTFMESGIAFIAADNPHANKLMIHMLAAFAEHERDQIRVRTKAALAAAKARGVVLWRYGREVLSKENHAKPTEGAHELAPLVIELRARGLPVAQITEIMNQRCIPTAQGQRWHPATAWSDSSGQKYLSRNRHDHPTNCL